jgi:hypothetical protein
MAANPADKNVLQEIFDDHKALKALLAKIDETLGQRQATVAEATRLLNQLGNHLMAHFALEESGGYFTEAVLHAPHLAGRSKALMDQHDRFLTAARALIAPTGEGADSWWEETRRRFAGFQQELLRHERSEDSLLQEAYVDDLGSEGSEG